MIRPLVTLALSLSLMSSVAEAHDLAATLGVVDPVSRDSSICDGLESVAVPRIIRTSVGPVYRLADGGWAFGCPALHGEGATGPIVQMSEGTLVSVSDSRIWRSTDDGCTWSEVPLPDERWLAYDVVGAEDVALVLARSVVESGVFEVRSTGAILSRFASARDIEIDADALTPDGAAIVSASLVVAGARPVADVRWVELASTRSLGVPQTQTELQRLSIRGQVGGYLWVMATTEAGRQLARLASLDGEAAWDWSGPLSQSIHGPVMVGGALWAVFDGGLHRLDADDWAEVLAGPFTCVSGHEDTLWACERDTLTAFQLVGAERDPDRLDAVPVFSFIQLGARPERCAWDDEVEQLCANEWVHYGAENGFVGRVPARCPDGRPATRDATDPSGDCSAGRSGHPIGAGLWWMPAMVAFRVSGRRS